ncbi:MAG: hypothetical protein WCB90_11360 [Methanosarcina sp.]
MSSIPLLASYFSTTSTAELTNKLELFLPVLLGKPGNRWLPEVQENFV